MRKVLIISIKHRALSNSLNIFEKCGTIPIMFLFDMQNALTKPIN